jgi:NADH-quinone oxidoreductase subunit H
VALQPSADGLKLFSKENLNRYTQPIYFFSGPAIAMTTALMTSAVIPWGDRFHLLEDIILQATDIDVALLYFWCYVNRCLL